MDAVIDCDADRVRQILQSHPELVNMESRTKWSWELYLPLEEALTAYSETFTTIAPQPMSEQLAAQAAKAQNQKIIAALLLDHGGHIRLNRKSDGFNSFPNGARTPLQHAILYGTPDLVALLLDRGADIAVLDAHGLTAFQEAVKYDKIAVASLLLAHGAKANEETKSGDTPLELAVIGRNDFGFSASNSPMYQILLDHDADANQLDGRGRSAFEFAMKERHFSLAQALLTHGIDLHTKTSQGETPLLLVLAAGWADTMLLVLDAPVINEADKQGTMPLHWAVRHASEPLSSYSGLEQKKQRAEWQQAERLLLYKGADINAADNLGVTPLLYTLLHRDRASYDLLKQHGAKTDTLTALFESAAFNNVSHLAQGAAANAALAEIRAPTGATLLHIAALWGAADTTRFLLRRGTDPNAGDADGQTPLLFACRFRGNEAAVRLLLMRGADPNLIFKETSPLTLAFETKSPEMVRLLLNAGAGPHPLDSLLLPAIRTQSTPIVKLLLEHGAQFEKPKKGQDRTFVLQQAIRDDTGPKMVRLLLAYRAAVTPNTPNATAPLVDAAQRGQTAVVQCLLGYGAGDQGQKGKALIAATQFHQLDVVRLLLDNKTDVNSKDSDGQTALMNAVSQTYIPGERWEDTVQLLLDRGADVNAAAQDGSTALIEAARSGSLEVVALLLKRGADVNARSQRGETALKTARKFDPRNKAITNLLLQAGAKE